MILNIILFLAGLFFLVKGSGIFVKSASAIAKNFNVSDFVIGLTLIALGTSLPELVSSIFASLEGGGALIIGTLVGASIANLSIIIGTASIINPIKTKKDILKREGYMLLTVLLLLWIFSYDGLLSRGEGALFVLVFVTYNLFLIDSVKKIKKQYDFNEFTRYFFKFQYLSKIKRISFRSGKNNKKISEKERLNQQKRKKAIFRNLLFLILGGLFIYFGAKYVVEEALFFADSLGTPLFIVGILISIGTSLPELSVSISASRKKLGNIAMGNALGSCITNLLLILGLAALINPISITTPGVFYALGFLSLLALVSLVFMETEWMIKKVEGISLILLYLVFLVFIVLGVF